MLSLEIIYNLLSSREYLVLDISSAIEYKIVSVRKYQMVRNVTLI